MFLSEGCAVMNGGGDLEMEAYSLVRRLVAAGVAMVCECGGRVSEWVVGVVDVFLGGDS